MSGLYLLGIDNGNTVTKVSLYHVDGSEKYTASRSAATLVPHTGWAERDMTMHWRNTAEAIRETIEKSDVQASEIIGIGCTGHGNGLYLLDKQKLPFRNAIQSMDTRAVEIVQRWEQTNLRSRVFPNAPQAFYPAQTVALLAWLRQHEPESYRNLGSVMLCKDYINFRLTGNLLTDMSDASSANLIDTINGKLSEALLSHFGIAEMVGAIPPLTQSLDIIGKVTSMAAEETGLAVGTPVIGGMIDCAASSIGIGVVEPGQICILIGTWSINQVIVPQPSWTPDLFLTAPFADPLYWLLLEGSATSAANLEWFVTHFGAEERLAAEKRGISPYDICNEAVENIRPEEATIIYHPFLYGSHMQANASASFFGISGWHTRAHLLRAVYEGVVFGHLLHIDKLRQAGTEFGALRMGGGGARSSVWVQMFADMLQIPAEVPEGRETGTRGAALAAGIATGVYRDLAEAVKTAVRVIRVHEPNVRNEAVYRARYEQYKMLIGSMQPQWDAIHHT